MKFIEHYYGLCERTSPEFWAEPLNALSNLAFLIAGAAIYSYYRNHQDVRGKWIWDIHVLTILIFFIGIASFIFHTIPSRYTEIADIIFIVIFINIYFMSAVRRIAKCNVLQLVICLLAFWGTTHMLVSQFPNAMNDSISYLSSMMALITIAIYLNMKRRVSARMYLLASLIGVVSLFFRSIDNAVCDVFPVGMHFLWHILNSVLLYILMIQLIRNVNRKARMLRLKKERKARERYEKSVDIQLS